MIPIEPSLNTIAGELLRSGYSDDQVYDLIWVLNVKPKLIKAAIEFEKTKLAALNTKEAS